MLKKLTLIVAVILITTCNPFIAFGQNFEGVVNLNTTNSETKDIATVKWTQKDGDHKLEIVGTADDKPYETKVLILKNDNNVHILTTIDGQAAQYSVPGELMKTNENSGIATKTGESKTIAGYNCFKYQILTQSGATTCWVSDATALSSKNFPPSLSSKGVIGILLQNGITGVPLEIISRNQSGDIVNSQIVTAISASSINDTQFTIPGDAQSGEELLKKSIEVE